MEWQQLSLSINDCSNAQALGMLLKAGGDPVREAKLHGNLAATMLARCQPYEALGHCELALKVCIIDTFVDCWLS